MLSVTFLLTLLLQFGDFEEINNIKVLTKLYETNLNTSISLERQDVALRHSWAADVQVKRINVTTKYRLQMTRHKEHSFNRTNVNEKWVECLYLHRREIRKAIKDYYGDESECLTTATAGDKDRTGAVEQVEKEIRRWRKGYRYLVNRCKADNPNDENGSKVCLVEYMEKDHYNQVVQRLILLKLEAMGELFLQLTSSLADLEQCLGTQLSVFLEKVRLTMDTLAKCYTLKTQGSE